MGDKGRAMSFISSRSFMFSALLTVLASLGYHTDLQAVQKQYNSMDSNEPLDFTLIDNLARSTLI